MTEERQRMTVHLGNIDGPSGNAYVILGRCERSMEQHGRTKEEVEKFMTEAMSGDYDHLLATVDDYFDTI